MRAESKKHIQGLIVAGLLEKKYDKADAEQIAEDLWPTAQKLVAESVDAGLMAPPEMREMAKIMNLLERGLR